MNFTYDYNEELWRTCKNCPQMGSNNIDIYHSGIGSKKYTIATEGVIYTIIFVTPRSRSHQTDTYIII
jgi:hypothetical protein